MVFAILLAAQYLRRRRKHQLVWTVALFMFFLTSLLAFLSELMGWSVIMYQFFYFLTAPPVALMGVGTLYLLAHKPWGKYFLAYTLIISAVFFAVVFTVQVDTALFTQGTPSDIGSKAMPSNARLSPLLSIPGGLVLIGGGLYSFWLDRSRKYSLLIALGGIFNFLGGVISRLLDPTYLFVFTTVGVLLLFLGFLLSNEYVKKREKK